MADTKVKTGKDLFDLLNKHKGEKYIYGANVPKDDSKWKGPWDCAEFISWGIFQLIRKLYGVLNSEVPPSRADAYTGAFHDELSLFDIISLAEAAKTIGAIILRFPSSIAGHIVVSDGKGGTIEAHSTADGVINSVISGRRWDVAFKLKELNYTQSKSDVIVSPPKTIIYAYKPHDMMGSQLVIQIKAQLIKEGFIIDYPESGLYDYQTSVMIRDFQIRNKLLIDGEVGPQTAKALGISL